MNTFSDHLYIKELKKGSESAFKHVFEKHYQGLFQYALSYLKEEEEAENIIQDVFVLLWENRKDLDEETNLQGYLVVSTKYLLWNEINKKKRRMAIHKKIQTDTLKEIDLQLYTLDHSPLSLLCAKEINEIVDKALNSQSDTAKKIFLLSRKEHLSYKEIAKKLELSPKTIEYHISKVLNILRKELSNYLKLILVYILFS